jgi:hypothetical protein
VDSTIGEDRVSTCHVNGRGVISPDGDRGGSAGIDDAC